MVKATKLSDHDGYEWYWALVKERSKTPAVGLTEYAMENGHPVIHMGELVCRWSLGGSLCKAKFEGTNTLRAHVKKAHDKDLPEKKGQGKDSEVVAAKEYFGELRLATIRADVSKAQETVNDLHSSPAGTPSSRATPSGAVKKPAPRRRRTKRKNW